MNRGPSRRTICLTCTLFTFIVSMTNSSFPIRITPALHLQCSIQPPSLNLSKEQLFDNINQLLTKKYGDPQDPPFCSCARSGPWRRISFLNFTETDTQCPSNWALHNMPVRGCKSKSSAGCDSAIFSTYNFTYNRVCGRIIGYQKGTTNAFDISIMNVKTIEQNYVDGLSLTHGPPGSRKHIWTFAAALGEESESSSFSIYNCACTNDNYPWLFSTPSFVKNNYFCDTGNPGLSINQRSLYYNNPLWDGRGCGPHSTCCQFNNPPWFCTSLLQPTTDDLELRICLDQTSSNENIIISSVELYISYD